MTFSRQPDQDHYLLFGNGINGTSIVLGTGLAKRISLPIDATHVIIGVASVGSAAVLETIVYFEPDETGLGLPTEPQRLVVVGVGASTTFDPITVLGRVLNVSWNSSVTGTWQLSVTAVNLRGVDVGQYGRGYLTQVFGQALGASTTATWLPFRSPTIGSVPHPGLWQLIVQVTGAANAFGVGVSATLPGAAGAQQIFSLAAPQANVQANTVEGQVALPRSPLQVIVTNGLAAAVTFNAVLVKL